MDSAVNLARELGAAVQSDPRYAALQAARAANEADGALTALTGKIKLVQMSYQNEAGKAEPDEEKLAAYDREFQEVYGELMLNANMKNYEAARAEMDDLMNYIVQILSMSVNGEDPFTCEPQEQGCGAGGCSSCAGCG